MHLRVLALSLLLLLAGGCSSPDSGPRELASTLAPMHSSLPAPAQLERQLSGLSGSAYCQGAELQLEHNALASGSGAVFSPAWDGSIDSGAWAVYSFNLNGFDGTPELDLYWLTPPAAGTAYVAFADFARNSWNWELLGDVNQRSVASLSPFIRAGGRAYVAILLTGAVPADLSALRFGASAAPVARISATPSSTPAPVLVDLDASASIEGGSAIANYSWDLDNDGLYETDGGAVSTYSDYLDLPAGQYSVGVRVQDIQAHISTAKATITITGTQFFEPPQETFVDNAPGGNNNTKWLTNCYKPLPPWHDDNRCFQNVFFRQQADDLAALINAYRAENGKPALVYEPHLELVAQAHCRHMALTNFFDYVDPYGLWYFDRVQLAGAPPFINAGESFGGGFTAAAPFMNVLKMTPTDNANLLSTSFTHFGVGCYYSTASSYQYYWTVDYWDFTSDPSLIDWLDPEEVP